MCNYSKDENQTYSFSGRIPSYLFHLILELAWTYPVVLFLQITSTQGHKFPATPLQIPAIKNILTQQIIEPTNERDDKVCAFRMVWSTKHTPEETIWHQISQQARFVLDEQIKKIKGVSFFISTVTATVSNQQQRRDITPAIGYFVVGDRAGLLEPPLYISLRNNPFGGILKLLTERGLKPGYDRNLHWLTILLKDNVPGYVQEKVSRNQGGIGLPLVKIYVRDELYLHHLSRAKAELDAAGFPVNLEQF